MSENGKIGLAKQIATSLRDKLAEVLIVAMFLGVGTYLGRDVGGALVNALHSIANQMGAMAQGMTIVIERTEASTKMREHEHDELQTQLRECMEMGHALSECQQRDRR